MESKPSITSVIFEKKNEQITLDNIYLGSRRINIGCYCLSRCENPEFFYHLRFKRWQRREQWQPTFTVSKRHPRNGIHYGDDSTLCYLDRTGNLRGTLNSFKRKCTTCWGSDSTHALTNPI